MPYHLICRCLPATATVCPVREVERDSRRATAPGWQAKSGRWKAAAGGRRDFVPSDGDVPKNNRAPSKSAFFDGEVPFFCRPPSLFRMLRQGARDAPLFPACDRRSPPWSRPSPADRPPAPSAARQSRRADRAAARFRNGRCRVFLLPLQGL